MIRIVLLFFLSCGLLFGSIEDYVVGTWNLQGSSASTENKWNVSVRQLITGSNPVDILMVQEAGSVPRSARRTGRVIQPGGTPIEEYVWDLGTRSRPTSVFIYYANIDVGARRVNLAIVSNRQADEVFVVRQSTIAPEVSRPAIGIRIGNEAFFNIHALASGGGDATALVTAVHDNFLDRRTITWLIAGDFNRDPASLLSGLDRRISNHIHTVSQNSATHFSSTGANRILDYAVVGRSSRDATATLGPIPIVALLMAAGMRSHLSSDHFPVRFGKF
ncbi:MAG: cytolethal distending toxin subunit B family protein [Helicobacter sp.]|uniref:cytolethal distending toxin subunit B family protein n=1 Tax=Helicobacter sp. 10-6591 TaxID=2004998 RepID=UPI000DCD2F09|nr:cytolethal distending toxin subunit B family protein [Helicobacter sp. 10-6591]MCI6217380.1 cytolethal distending toxin subunit B family protein [Helicobacter sp.]MDD7567654.1 cytolethal distending toxin subunit B family protein [Helicobacter sp.]MDY5740295.1 cytolethal distending toxin subunit B family protein [Helicobacter sp.]RAX53233.1 cytolethal distending toxin subunit CdtB [Helicobacter sp. 10-6591]